MTFALRSFNRIFPAATVFAISFIISHSSLAQSEPPAGFKALFNGRDLEGWYGLEHFDPRLLRKMSETERKAKQEAGEGEFKKHWRVDNGEMVNDGAGPYATTLKEFGDIELLIDFKLTPKADSGIYLRGNPQVQIWDYTEAGGHWRLGADKGSGGLWNNSAGAPGKDPLVLADNPPGQWNKFRIIQVGSKTTVYLNDKLAVDGATMENFWERKAPLWPKGPIQLQTHGGELRWKNIFIRELTPTEANEYLGGKHEGDFKSIFNGKDLDGWGGPTDGFEVKNGEIIPREGEGGTIYTRDMYADFVVRFEYQIQAGGEHGVAIRYPGSGNPAYVGMCRIQLGDEKVSANHDPRTLNGAAYGLAPAHQGFARTAGAWNFAEIAVVGSTIKYDLNGSTILNSDLKTISTFLEDHPHPGKDRRSGHFGLIGSSDTVKFRNISIKKLQRASRR